MLMIGGEGCMIRREDRYFPREWDWAPVGDLALIPPLPLEIWGNMLILILMFCNDLFMDDLRGLGLCGA